MMEETPLRLGWGRRKQGHEKEEIDVGPLSAVHKQHAPLMQGTPGVAHARIWLFLSPQWTFLSGREDIRAAPLTLNLNGHLGFLERVLPLCLSLFLFKQTEHCCLPACLPVPL